MRRPHCLGLLEKCRHSLLAFPPSRRGRTAYLLNAVVLIFHIAVSLTLVVLVLLHAGRGGGLSDMFGGGSLGGSMAGSTVVERNLDRITVIIALMFTFTTILLGLRVG